MKALDIYDPAMCCSTGVCGPSVDPKLVRLAADVAFLKSQGVAVERHNLAHQPADFAASPLVVSEMGEEAEHLPLFISEGKVLLKGAYPTRQEMAAWFGLEASAAQKPLAALRMAAQPQSGDAPGRCC